MALTCSPLAHFRPLRAGAAHAELVQFFRQALSRSHLGYRAATV